MSKQTIYVPTGLHDTVPVQISRTPKGYIRMDAIEPGCVYVDRYGRRWLCLNGVPLYVESQIRTNGTHTKESDIIHIPIGNVGSDRHCYLPYGPDKEAVMWAAGVSTFNGFVRNMVHASLNNGTVPWTIHVTELLRPMRFTECDARLFDLARDGSIDEIVATGWRRQYADDTKETRNVYHVLQTNPKKG